MVPLAALGLKHGRDPQVGMLWIGASPVRPEVSFGACCVVIYQKNCSHPTLLCEGPDQVDLGCVDDLEGLLLIGSDVPIFRNPFCCQLSNGAGRFKVGRPSWHGGAGMSQPVGCLVGTSSPSGIIISATGWRGNHNNLVDSLLLA
jgi:hypothetical protein